MDKKSMESASFSGCSAAIFQIHCAGCSIGIKRLHQGLFHAVFRNGQVRCGINIKMPVALFSFNIAMAVSSSVKVKSNKAFPSDFQLL